MRRPRLTASRACSSLAVAGTVLSLAACGGGGASTGATPLAVETSTRPAVVVRADAICSQVNSELLASLPKTVSAHEVATVSPRTAALEQRVVEQLARLRPPAKIAREWDEVVSYRRSLAHALLELAAVAKTNDKKAMRKLGEYKERVRTQLRQVGEHVGFTSCQTVG
jgi:hypothetical protein